jgi:hypothetical protein
VQDVHVEGLPTIRIRGTDTQASAATLPYPIARVWAVLPSVLDSLGVPIADMDAAHHLVGNSALKIRQRLGKTPLSRYLDCGATQGFPSADTYDIQLSVLSQLEADPTGSTKIGTFVQAVGRPGFGGESINCSSKTTLERLVADQVLARLQR